MSKSKALLARGMSPSRAAAAFGAKSLIVASVAAMPLVLWSAGARALEPIELLGKNLFFDTSLSTPGNKQGCVSCHAPAKGWAFPDAGVNAKTVVAPGAAPHRLGDIKPPNNSYMSLAPAFQEAPGFSIPGVGPILPGFAGGNFWNGRAEGCGAAPGSKCPVPNAGDIGELSETITPAALPLSQPGASYKKFLGATADQALNPFPKGVEQNAGEKKVCTQVKTAKYKALYRQAYGEPINCQDTGVHTSFQRIAVALAAYQKSEDVVPFDSKRDRALAADADKKFPLDDTDGGIRFTNQENLGHDLFYGIESELNKKRDVFGDGIAVVPNANCSACHNGQPNTLEGFAPSDTDGTKKFQVYTDFKYHHIGVPFNREIPGVAKGKKKGLADHVVNTALVESGFFKTPTVRNVAKGLAANGKGKAFTHNGYFKSLETLVHFYNTRDKKPACAIASNPNPTEEEALANNCWPKPEFDNNLAAGKLAPPGGRGGIPVGDLGLTKNEELAVVAYLKTLSDISTASAP